MMPLSFPRYTFFSEFMGAGQTGRLGETAALKREKKRKCPISSNGLREAEERERERGGKGKNRVEKRLC